MPAGLAASRRRPRAQGQPLRPEIDSGDTPAFDALSSKLRSYLAAQELLAAVGTPSDRVVDLAGTPHEIAEPPAGAALAAAVAATANRLRQEGPARAVEIAAQDRHLELMFALAIGLAESPAAAAPHTLDLIDTVSWATAWPLYRAKYRLRVQRPNQVDPTIVPLIETPSHASYPSGHATAAFALAEVLTALTGAAVGDDLQRALAALAERIADNRECAGLHTAPDTAAGRALGSAMGRWMVEMAVSRQTECPVWAMLYARASLEWTSMTGAKGELS
jgi:hypothetical protein